MSRIPEHDARIVILIADDSREEFEQPNRQLLRGLQAQSGNKIIHFDTAAKKRISDFLCKESGCERRIVEHAVGLSPCLMDGYGANRNLLLLASTGETILMSDDDIRWEGVALTPRNCLFENAHSALKIGAWDFQFLRRRTPPNRILKGDILLHHEHFLGMDLRNPEGPERFKVGMTVMGAIGDAGVDSMGYLLLLSDKQLGSLATDADLYTAVKQNRLQARFVTEPRLLWEPALITMNFGLDNRSEVPPFFPTGRGEDGCFGVMTRLLDNGLLTAALPGMVDHRPPNPRTRQKFDPDFLDDGFTPASLALILLSYSLRERKLSRCDLGKMAQILDEVAHLSDQAFDERIDTCCQPYLHTLEEKVQARAGGEFPWAADARYTLATLQSLRRNRNYLQKSLERVSKIGSASE